MKRISKIFILVVVSALFVIIFVFAESITASLQSGIVVLGCGKYLGHYPLGSIVKHRYTIINIQFQQNTIYLVERTCSCSELYVSRYHIPSFSTATIDVSTDTKGKKIGPYTSAIIVKMANGSQRLCQFHIHIDKIIQ